MPDSDTRSRLALRTVLINLPAAQVLDKEPFFIFAARQIEEVLPEVKVLPLPFAPEWLNGLCAWRHETLPVIDMAVLYDIACTIERHFYLVVRVILSGENAAKPQQEKQLRRCVLKVSDQIAAGGLELSGHCETAAAEQTGIDTALIRGMFTHEDRLLILPELSPLLRTPTGF